MMRCSVGRCFAWSLRSKVGGAAEEAASDGRGFEDPAVNPARRLGGKQTDRIFNSLDSKDVRRAEGGKCVHAKARKKKRDCSPF